MMMTRPSARRAAALCLTAALLWPGVALRAQTTETVDGVKYTLSDDHYEVTGFDASTAPKLSGSATLYAVVVKPSLHDVAVSTVAANAFSTVYNRNCANIGTLSLPSSVTSLGQNAFRGCSSLSAVELPSQLVTIGSNCFRACQSLSAVDVPSSVVTIGSYAFYGCKGLERATFGSGLATIGSNAFCECDKLLSLSFSGPCPTVELAAFSLVGTQASPAVITVLPEYAGTFAAAMDGDGRRYSFAQSVGCIYMHTTTGGVRYEYEHSEADGSRRAHFNICAFDAATAPNRGTSSSPRYHVTVPQDLGGCPVTTLLPHVFDSGSQSACASIARLTLPSTIDSVGTAALSGCTLLPYIDLGSSAVSGVAFSRESGSFAGTSAQTVVYLPSGNTSAAAEPNLLIGSAVVSSITVYAADGSAAAVLSPATDVRRGRAAYLLNRLWNEEVFGQRIGRDTIPTVLSDAASEQVYQVAFHSTDTTVYRYANYGGTVELPTCAELLLAPEVPLSHFIGSSTSKLTASTVITSSLDVYSMPTATAITFPSHTVYMSLSSGEQTLQLTCTVLPAGSSGKVTWASSDEHVATVDSDGRVHAHKAGYATITASSAEDPLVRNWCVVIVNGIVETFDVVESSLTIRMSSSIRSVRLTTDTEPKPSNNSAYWSSSDERVARVDHSGLVTAVGGGSALITAVSADNGLKWDTCRVTVIPQATSISVAPSPLTLITGRRTTLEATLLPALADQQVSWSSADRRVVAVTDDGTLTALSTGTTTVTATSMDTPGLSASCQVEVVGVGGLITVDSITYRLQSISDDDRRVSIERVGESLLACGGSFEVPARVSLFGDDYLLTAAAADAVGRASNNTVVFLPPSVAYDGTASNVVVCDAEGQRTCRNLVLTGSADFSVPYAFTASHVRCAAKVLYGQTEAGCVSLPFSMAAVPGTLQFYAFQGLLDNRLEFVETDHAEAYVPYIFTGGKDNHGIVTAIEADSVMVAPTPQEPRSVTSLNYTFKGTTCVMSHAEAVADNAFVMGLDGVWHPIQSYGTNSRIPAFSAYMSVGDATSLPSDLVTAVGGVSASTPSSAASDAWYTLQGVRLSRRPSAPGTYIHQGRCVVIRRTAEQPIQNAQ